MEGNPNDKALREKLRSAEYPYDPAAWAEMEKMLDNRKKRFGFFWWSALGVTATLMLSACIYVAAYYNTDKAGAMATNTSSTSGKNKLDRQTITGIAQAPPSSQPQTQTGAQGTNYISGKNGGNTMNGQYLSNTSPSGPATLPSYRSSAPSEQIASIEPVTPTQSAVLNIPEIQLSATSLNTISSTCIYDDPQDAVPIIPMKHRGKVSIHYQLGLTGGVYESYAAKTYGNRPTLAVGLSQELQIGKYFAITNSILYSDVSFRVNNPKYPDNSYLGAEAYSSHLREVVIPIGIKVYPYSSRLIRIGVGISYVNHYKLKETFDYKTTTKQVNTGVMADQSTDFPPFNPFVTVDPNKSITSLSNPPRPSVVSDYYSIGNGRRYYGSLAYTASVEFLLPHHFSIAAEPCFMMSLDKIKMQNSRVFDFGINAGVKYTF